MSKQVDNGKAFEYILIKTLYYYLPGSVKIEGTDRYNHAERCYYGLPYKDRQDCYKAAYLGYMHLLNTEPVLGDKSSGFTLKLEKDSAGMEGDVRDVVIIHKSDNRTIGISAKHGHAAVKHSRISRKIDIGQKWMGVFSTNTYFQTVNPIFKEIEEYRNQKILWKDINNKEVLYYIPILKAFQRELITLTNKHKEAAHNLLSYLIGKEDFYKIIKYKDKVEVHGYNINNTLNKTHQGIKPEATVPVVNLPDRVFDIYFKTGSSNTLYAVFDEGWQVSFRIHNASSKVESSLKFDVQLIGVPTNLYKFTEKIN